LKVLGKGFFIGLKSPKAELPHEEEEKVFSLRTAGMSGLD